MPPPTDDLLLAAKSAALLTYEQLAQRVGSSRRTVQRWAQGQSVPTALNWHNLARVVHPHDPELAAQIAGHAGTTLEALGIVKPAPPPPAPAPAPPPRPALTLEHVDALVCAAADALDVRPRKVRAVVEAVFVRAARLGYSTEDVARAFAAAPAAVTEGAAGAEK